MTRPNAIKSTIRLRQLKNPDVNALRYDVVNSPLILTPADELTALADQYHSVKHAPESTCTITLCPHTHWYDETLRKAKREKRSCERKWKSSVWKLLHTCRQIFHESCSDYKKLLQRTKTRYHRSIITNCGQNQLFSVIDKLSVTKTPSLLPSGTSSAEELANGFVNFFV